MARTFQIKRGLKADMPTLAQGELGMTTDSGAESLFIGTGTENIEFARKSDLDAIPTPDVSGQIGAHNSDSSAHSDIRTSITTHTGDTSIHVTADQKATWDAKATTTYVDQKISEIPTPDVSGQIGAHNSDSSAHSDIRESITTHTGDASIHVTAEEKAAWNAKVDESYVSSMIDAAIGNAIGGSY